MDRRIYEKKREERKRRKKNKWPADTDHPYIISCAWSGCVEGFYRETGAGRGNGSVSG